MACGKLTIVTGVDTAPVRVSPLEFDSNNNYGVVSKLGFRLDSLTGAQVDTGKYRIELKAPIIIKTGGSSSTVDSILGSAIPSSGGVNPANFDYYVVCAELNYEKSFGLSFNNNTTSAIEILYKIDTSANVHIYVNGTKLNGPGIGGSYTTLDSTYRGLYLKRNGNVIEMYRAVNAGTYQSTIIYSHTLPTNPPATMYPIAQMKDIGSSFVNTVYVLVGQTYSTTWAYNANVVNTIPAGIKIVRVVLSDILLASNQTSTTATFLPDATGQFCIVGEEPSLYVTNPTLSNRCKTTIHISNSSVLKFLQFRVISLDSCVSVTNNTYDIVNLDNTICGPTTCCISDSMLLSGPATASHGQLVNFNITLPQGQYPYAPTSKSRNVDVTFVNVGNVTTSENAVANSSVTKTVAAVNCTTGVPNISVPLTFYSSVNGGSVKLILDGVEKVITVPAIPSRVFQFNVSTLAGTAVTMEYRLSDASPWINFAATFNTVLPTTSSIDFRMTVTNNTAAFVEAHINNSYGANIAEFIAPGATETFLNENFTFGVGSTVYVAYTTAVSPSPTITSISPTQGQSGTPVTIVGTNFSYNASQNIVKFNGVPGIITYTYGTQLIANAPANVTTGPIEVTNLYLQQSVTGPTFTVVASNITLTKQISTYQASVSAIKYSINGGTWTTWSATTLTVSTADQVSFRATFTRTGSGGTVWGSISIDQAPWSYVDGGGATSIILTLPAYSSQVNHTVIFEAEKVGGGTRD